MKRIKCILFISIVFTLFTCNEQNEKADMQEENQDSQELRDAYALIRDSAILKCINMPLPDDTYDYPVLPGTQKWESFTTGEQMVEALQIPATVTKKLSTQALIQTIWEYPLLLDVFHRNQYQMDFESIFLKNNAYLELSKRTDAGAAILQRIVVVDPLVPEARFLPRILELLIAQPIFLSQLNSDEKKLLIQTLLEKEKLRADNPELANGSIGYEVVWLSVGRTLFEANYQPFVEAVNGSETLKLFLQDKTYVYIKEVYLDITQRISVYAKEYLQ
jgi:hypothetical protein